MIEVEFDTAALARFVDKGKRAIERAMDNVTDDLADNLQREAAPISSRAARPWRVRPGSGEDRVVVADEEAWFAHFLAGGTRAHGPRSANRLVFRIDGETIFARRVRGIAANHFDERAIDKTEKRVDQIMTRAIRETV